VPTNETPQALAVDGVDCDRRLVSDRGAGHEAGRERVLSLHQR